MSQAKERETIRQEGIDMEAHLFLVLIAPVDKSVAGSARALEVLGVRG
jgi:hypothetical protein